jgi:hypothetical protein
MRQLTELHFGTAEKIDSSSNVYTVDSFKAVLNTLEQMPKLTILVMHLQHVKDLRIGRGWEP